MRRLYLLGDSTCADKKKEARPETGWGEMFYEHLAQDWIVVNCAFNGYSTKQCLSTGTFGSVHLSAKEGDAVIIQFGHNDEKIHDERGSLPYTGFVANLKYMAQELKAKGVDVYFLTQVPRRRFEGKTLVDTHGDYTAAVKYAAYLSQVPCVDITIPAMLHLNSLGVVESKKYFMNFPEGVYLNYPEGKEDNTHLRPEGAKWIASLVADGLGKLEKKPDFLV